MSRLLQRPRHPKTQLTSQPQSQPTPSSPIAPGRTAYISTNTAEQKSFYADAPAGSQHAARLQKLALQQQPEYRPPPAPNPAQMLERKVQRSITAQGEPLPPGYNGGIASPSPASPGQASRRQSSDTAVSGCQECAAAAAQSADSTYQHNTHHSPSSQSRPTKPTTVDRIERGGTIAYHKKAAGGELLMSAPVGSQEARAMDDTAARLLASQAVYPTDHVEDDERQLVVERRPRGRGRRGGGGKKYYV